MSLFYRMIVVAIAGSAVVGSMVVLGQSSKNEPKTPPPPKELGTAKGKPNTAARYDSYVASSFPFAKLISGQAIDLIEYKNSH